jgi:hypothetical protein
VVITPPVATIGESAIKLTFPVPAVIVVTLSLATLAVVPVRPAPNVIKNVAG